MKIKSNTLKQPSLQILAFALTIVLLGSSCRTIRELKALSKCQFRIGSLVNARLAGINVQNIRSFTDLNLGQAAKVTSAYMSGNLPLEFTLNIEVKNPNSELAALNRLDWIAQYNDIDLINGVVNQRVAVQPNGGVARIPLGIRCNVKKVLQKLGREKALESPFELADERNRPKKVAVKLKPSMTIGKQGKSIPYPGYITVKKDFTAG